MNEFCYFPFYHFAFIVNATYNPFFNDIEKNRIDFMNWLVAIDIRSTIIVVRWWLVVTYKKDKNQATKWKREWFISVHFVVNEINDKHRRCDPQWNILLIKENVGEYRNVINTCTEQNTCGRREIAFFFTPKKNALINLCVKYIFYCHLFFFTQNFVTNLFQAF